MSNSCREPLKNLIRCVRSSDCVLIQGNSVDYCCRDPHTVSMKHQPNSDHDEKEKHMPYHHIPTLYTMSALADTPHPDSSSISSHTVSGSVGICSSEAQLYLFCKREQLDMRSRMRGNKALR